MRMNIAMMDVDEPPPADRSVLCCNPDDVHNFRTDEQLMKIRKW